MVGPGKEKIIHTLENTHTHIYYCWKRGSFGIKFAVFVFPGASCIYSRFPCSIIISFTTISPLTHSPSHHTSLSQIHVYMYVCVHLYNMYVCGTHINNTSPILLILIIQLENPCKHSMFNPFRLFEEDESFDTNIRDLIGISLTILNPYLTYPKLLCRKVLNLYL